MGLSLLLAGCGPELEQPDLARAGPTFVPEQFFGGRSHGEATLDILFSGRERVVVDSFGRIAPDGSLVLDQTIRREGRKAKQRRWVMRPAGPGRFGGSLSEADGPIRLETRGNTLRIRYRTEDGLDAEQWLYLTADGRAAANRLGLSKWGVRVATIEETIRKIG